jgi:hypothetical protein
MHNSLNATEDLTTYFTVRILLPVIFKIPVKCRTQMDAEMLHVYLTGVIGCYEIPPP